MKLHHHILFNQYRDKHTGLIRYAKPIPLNNIKGMPRDKGNPYPRSIIRYICNVCKTDPKYECATKEQLKIHKMEAHAY